MEGPYCVTAFFDWHNTILARLLFSAGTLEFLNTQPLLHEQLVSTNLLKRMYKKCIYTDYIKRLLFIALMSL